MIDYDEFVHFCVRTIAGFVVEVEQLGDELVNERPLLEGANTPFAIATHAFAASRWWVGTVICGRPSDRDRAAEFVAVGSVAALADDAATTAAFLEDCSAELASVTEPALQPETENPLEARWTVGTALLHAYEELTQHLGHLQLTADVLRAAEAPSAGD